MRPDSTCGRRCHRMQYLLHSHRSESIHRDMEKTYLEILASVKSQSRFQWPSSSAHSSVIWRTWPIDWMQRGPMVWCCSTGSISRISISKNWKSVPTFC